MQIKALTSPALNAAILFGALCLPRFKKLRPSDLSKLSDWRLAQSIKSYLFQPICALYLKAAHLHGQSRVDTGKISTLKRAIDSRTWSSAAFTVSAHATTTP